MWTCETRNPSASLPSCPSGHGFVVQMICSQSDLMIWTKKKRVSLVAKRGMEKKTTTCPPSEKIHAFHPNMSYNMVLPRRCARTSTWNTFFLGGFNFVTETPSLAAALLTVLSKSCLCAKTVISWLGATINTYIMLWFMFSRNLAEKIALFLVREAPGSTNLSAWMPWLSVLSVISYLIEWLNATPKAEVFEVKPDRIHEPKCIFSMGALAGRSIKQYSSRGEMKHWRCPNGCFVAQQHTAHISSRKALHATHHILHSTFKHSKLSTPYTSHSTLYTLLSTLYTSQSTLYTLHFTLHSPHFTLYTLHSTLYTAHFTLYYSTPYTSYFKLHTPQ